MLPVDIFKLEAANNVKWVESAQDVEDAKLRIISLMQRSSCDYLILNRQTSRTLIVKCDQASSLSTLGRN